MEILTPQIIWKGYDASALPLSASVLSDKTENGVRTVLAYFNGPTTTDGVARVFVRCVLPVADKPVPAVVYMPDAHRPVSAVDVSYLVRDGYAAVLPDYAGEREDDARYTLYPRSMACANFTPDCLTEVPDDVRVNCWIIWAETLMRAVTFAASLDGVDAGRIAVAGDGIAAASVLKAAAVDGRVKCAVTLFSPGYRPEETEGRDYLSYKVALDGAAYAPMIKVPLLMMLSSNEQDDSTDDMSEIFELIPPESGSRLSISERTSHAFGVKQKNNVSLWLAYHLKGIGSVPGAPELAVSCEERRLRFSVTAPEGCDDVELFASQAMPRGSLRNWRRTIPEKTENGEYVAYADVYDIKQPVYAFANVCPHGGGMSVSTPVLSRVPALLGVAETPVKSSRLVYDGDMGTDDWVVQSPLAEKDTLTMVPGPFGIPGVSSSIGTMSTFKIGDAAYRGRGSLLLQIMIYSAVDQTVTFTVVARGDEEDDGYTSYSYSATLSPSDEWRKLTLAATDFKSPHAAGMEWENAVYLRVDSDAPVAISSMIWV